MEKGKIIVTGGAGYIGSHTIVELYSNGYEPVIVDNFSNSFPQVIDWLEDILSFRPKLYNVDCADLEAFEDVFKKEEDIKGVIHFAAYKAVGESVDTPLKYYRNNLDSLINLLALMDKYKVSNLVFSSSCTVYGIPENEIQVTEDTPLQKPSSPYGHTKFMAEQIIEDFIKSSTIKAVMLRYFNPVGAHESAKIGEIPIGIPSNLVPFITQTAMGWREILTVFGDDYDTADGSCIRDFIHVSDLANAHLKAIEYMHANDKPLDIFNLGTGNGSTVLELINVFESATGKKLNFKIGARREGDVPAIFANSAKANRELGWSCKKDLESCMLSAWKWQENIESLGLNIK